jgi:hypothetical protein
MFDIADQPLNRHSMFRHLPSLPPIISSLYSPLLGFGFWASTFALPCQLAKRDQ